MFECCQSYEKKRLMAAFIAPSQTQERDVGRTGRSGTRRLRGTCTWSAGSCERKPNRRSTQTHRSTTVALPTPSHDVYRTNPSTNSEYPVPSACPRKGKRRKNFHFTTGLRYNGEPHDLPAGKGWGGGGGTWSTFRMRVGSQCQPVQT
jgi:hypothetical protein